MPHIPHNSRPRPQPVPTAMAPLSKPPSPPREDDGLPSVPPERDKPPVAHQGRVEAGDATPKLGMAKLSMKHFEVDPNRVAKFLGVD